MLVISEPTFSIQLPDSFQLIRDEGQLQCVCREPAGVLSLTPEAVTDPENLPNLSRMLAGFLTRTGHPVATDELLRITSVPDAHGFSWQYTEEQNFHRLWLFGNRYSWLLLTFVCPEEARPGFHELLQNAVKTIRLKGEEAAG